MRRNTTRCIGVAAVLAVAAFLTACGDDDDDSTGDSGAPAASGPAINLGLVNTENSPAGNYADGRQGVEAAVKYINETLGGVNGRLVDVETCVTNGSPESSINCANQFVQEKKLAVMPHLDVGAPGAIPIYTQADMPYLGGIPISAEEYTGPTAYSYIGAAPAAVTGLAAYAGEIVKAKKVAILAPEIPAAHAAIDGFMSPVLTKLGVTDIETVFESATTADMTPAVTRAKNSDPDLIVVIFGGPACTSVMQAVNTLGISTSKMAYAQECAGKDQIASGGGGGEGAVYQSNFLSPDSDDPNVKIYREQMEKYAPDFIGVASEGGFNTVMNTYAILKKLDPSDITSETILAAVKATNNEPGFLSHPYTCDGNQFPGLSAICDASVRLLRFEDGKFVDATDSWINGAANLR